MHTVVRAYSGKGAKELFDLLEKRKTDVEKLLRGVEGLEGYTLARTHDGGISITTCRDQAGTDESLKVARDWITQNAGSTGADAPKVSEGDTILHLK